MVSPGPALQQLLNDLRKENAELKKRVAELEAEVERLKKEAIAAAWTGY